MSSLLNEIKKPFSKTFRRLFIKRKLSTTGLFESAWQEMSDDVQQWGKVRKEIDNVRYGQLTFGDMLMRVDNSSGRYNPEDDEASLWFGFGSQQRSLVKIEAGFVHQTRSAGGVWTNTEYPTATAVFHGLVSGDIPLSDQNVITLPVRPLLQIFRDYPARNLTGFTSTGVSASQFMAMIRDQTDGSGSFIFRPFFGDTTTNWNIAPTTNVYTNLNTSTAADVYDANVWDVIEKLLEAENMVAYIKRDGTFNFTTRDPTTAAAFEFFGAGVFDTQYGHTIKRISRYGKKQSDYFSRVEVKFRAEDTFSSFRVRESSFTVTGANDPWNRGHRTFAFENLWIANTVAADVILETIFTNVTNLKNQIEMTASFVPHLEVLDRVQVSFDSGGLAGTRWDVQDWAEAGTDDAADLLWEVLGGDAIRLAAQDFKILSIELDLDKLETKITGITA